MQAYGRAFAHVYNKRWTGFVHRVAPLLLEFYANTASGEAKHPILDLCCGTGQLALHFLEQGFLGFFSLLLFSQHCFFIRFW